MVTLISIEDTTWSATVSLSSWADSWTAKDMGLLFPKVLMLMIPCIGQTNKCYIQGGRSCAGARGAQWAKSEGEAVLLQFSGFTKDPMHDFNRLFC